MWDTPSPFSTDSIVPEYTADELQDTKFLKRNCKRMNKELARTRRETRNELKTSVKKCLKMLKAKEAGLAQHHADQNPAVIKARKELQDSEKFLSDFEYAYTLSANLDAIDHNKTVAKYNWAQASTSKPKQWKGEFSKSAFNDTSSFVQLGGQIHTGMNIVKARHSSHWKMPSETNIDIFAKNVNVSNEPSSLHCGDRLTPEEVRRYLWKQCDTQNYFKYASHIPRFGIARIDHPKHGIPFAKRQKMRTFLERKMEKLQKTLNKIPTYPRRNEELREEYSYALNEARRVYKSVTGKKEVKLQKRVGEIKKKMKGKLHMLHVLEAKDGGDMSFLKTLNNIEQAHYTRLQGKTLDDNKNKKKRKKKKK